MVAARVAAILWILNAFAQFYMIGKVMKFYRSAGMVGGGPGGGRVGRHAISYVFPGFQSLQAAQNEAIVGVASNKAVQQAAFNGAKQAATANWSQA